MKFWRPILVIFLWLAYVFGFSYLYSDLGAKTTLLAIIPVMFSASLWKRVGGVAAAIFGATLSVGLLFYADGESFNFLSTSLQDRLADLALYLTSGLLVGWVAHLNYELRKFKTKTKKAQYDPLTKLLNRASFSARLKSIINRSTQKNVKVGILFVDLDKFKYVNDTYGHDVGDGLLKQVANILRSSIRQGDVVGRLGGDEFLIAITDLKSPKAAELVADKIVKALNSPFKIMSKEVNISGSVGISIFPDDGNDVEELIKSADASMYSVKNSGKNSYELKNHEIRAKEERQSRFEKLLQYGFDNNEFELYYQPQIEFSNKHLRGFEVLLRWKNTELGVVTPDEILPAANAMGMLLSLDRWVLREASYQLASWFRKGYKPVKIAMNISEIQFQHSDFVKNIASAIEDFDLNPNWLELEITESVLLRDLDKSKEILLELSELGIGLVLDNFGQGFLPIEALQKMPLSILKIDRGLLKEILPDQTGYDKRKLLEALGDLGHKFDKKIMISGVETKYQHSLAEKLGFEFGQGYLYSRPLEAKKAQAYLKPIKNQAGQTVKN